MVEKPDTYDINNSQSRASFSNWIEFKSSARKELMIVQPGIYLVNRRHY
jgi:hypothetical protein